jgi:RNA polymerase sigma factor (sigma-70 family)
MSPRISIRLLAGQSDERLLRLVGEGHERAFEALVQRYRHPLLRYCRRMRLSEARAEDVLQQALLQAWLALTRGVEVRDLRPWLFRIVHNTAVNAMRGSSESHSELTDEVYATAAVAGESELDRRIAFREALTEVAALPQMQRQAIFLTAVDGQSHDEVASSLGITHGALRGLLYRARSTLRSAAAALTPAQLIEWASGGGGAATPTAERLGELSAGGGGIGITALLMKGAVLAATAGALAGSAGVVSHHHHGSPRSSERRPTPGGVSSTASSPAPRVAHPISSLPRLADSRRARSGGDARRAGNERHGGGKGGGRDRPGTGHGSRSDRPVAPSPSSESPAGADPGGGQGGGTGIGASDPGPSGNGSGDSPSGNGGGGGGSQGSSPGGSSGGSPESSSGEDGEDGGRSGQALTSGSSSGGDDAITDGSESTSGPGGGKGSQ